MQLITLSLVASSLAGVAHSIMTQGFIIDGEAIVDWEAAYRDGSRFVNIKATEGDTGIAEHLEDNWKDAEREGFICGAYHIGRPVAGAGKTQAEFFINHGGRWYPDNNTLSGTLEIRAPEYGDQCYGLSSDETLEYVTDWTEAYYKSEGRSPFLRFNLAWWDNCTNESSFPLNSWIAVIDFADSAPDYDDMQSKYGAGWEFWAPEIGYIHAHPGGMLYMWSGNLLQLQIAAR
ncbi:hypothetical protein FQN54_006640 [Arachnomyces sp. PD_36]|nr:hypothetical protein FQN54_006640 [Arachnomyces sp. PD_36]